jgi:alkylation response protein AidB-like acyl-CoA dehydrogenase
MTIGVTADHEALTSMVRGWAERTGLRADARAALEGPETRPTWWQALADQGLLGLRVSEESGGSGAGGVELAIAAEELGRAFAPGPALPTLAATLVLAQAGGTAAKELLPSLVDGTLTAAVAVEDTLLATAGDDGLVVSGTVRHVLAGATADLLVLGAEGTWFVVEAASVSVEPGQGTDPTRRPATVTLDRLAVPAARVLTGTTTAQVHALVGVVAAAEATGIAGWCLDTAVAYANTREQFGRLIGGFQAVKHSCADMLVRVEQARALVWDAARALDEAPSPARDLAEAAAIAFALDAAVENAKACIQVLGGIGFTWEHDAHIAFKRALSLRALVGSTAAWRQRVAALALDGARRDLDLDLDAHGEQLREELRAFLAALPSDARERRVALADAGWLVPHWPAPWGRDADAVDQLVIDHELAAAGVQLPNLVIGGWAAPTIVAHGTAEQQERFVRPTLHGDITWCQLFSEPGAGSDLAGLQTRAEKVEGGWKVNGQKVWTSVADRADWGILLVRTSGEAKGPARHKGITYLLLDMKTPGVEIRPLREITGHALFNEVFFDDVFVPDDCVVGEVDGGWKLARTTLANERVAMSSGSPLGRGVEDVLNDVTALGGGDALLRDRVGGFVCEALSQSLLAFRTTLRRLSGADPGAGSSVRKLVGMRHQQDISELRYELAGVAGLALTPDDPVGNAVLQTRCLTIAGGTTEVLKNVAAERILGLPRD